MALSWYTIALTSLGATVILALFVLIVLRILRAKAREKVEQTYTPLTTDEVLTANEKRTPISNFKQEQKIRRSDALWDTNSDQEEDMTTLHNVTLVKERFADISTSDWETSSDRDLFLNANTMSRQDRFNTDVFDSVKRSRLQISLIYNAEKKYLAGKIIKLDDVADKEHDGPDQIKIHTVLMPTRKYILKTKYYNVKTSIMFNEYFKMKFRILPPMELTTIRYRIYGRNVKFGIPRKEHCLGEIYVTLLEVAGSRGGITVWKNIQPKANMEAND